MNRRSAIERLDDLLRTAPCGFFAFDDDGTVVESNDTLLRMLGTRRNCVVGRHIDRILSPGSRIFYQTHLFPLLKSNGKVEELYLSLRSEHGPRKVLVNGVRSERDGRMVNECIAVSIQRRETYEHELLISRKAAEAGNEAKARFLAMMSHELRTPLQIIFGFTDLLIYGLHGDVPPEQLEDLHAIRDASHDLARTISNILNLSQLETGWVEVRTNDVSLQEALSRAERAVRYRFQSSEVTYERQDLSPDILVRADPELMHQVLLNLILNAASATPRGGKVSTRCETRNGNAIIAVRDGGDPIPDDALHMAFQPFLPSSRNITARDESGLGLSVSREIARSMAGDVDVTNDKEGGAVFTVKLPIAGVRPASPEAST